tara:strand:+ start:536 stop:949 length:414 start_codon:yes stop_codon:yes gene_type:complete
MADHSNIPYYQKVGLNNVGSYQVSGYPYVTGNANMGSVGGEENRVSFPTVTKSITVINKADKKLRIHFNSSSVDARVNAGLHYIELTNVGDAITLNVKCKEVFLTGVQAAGAYQLYAELTGIPTASMFTLTGPGLTD